MSIGILGAILTILFFALMTGIIFYHLRLPTILGYLLVGAIAGPHAVGLIPDVESIKTLAEFGIVLLMFTIGLEFSLPKLIALRYWVFGVGEIQVIVVIAVTTIIGMAIGMTPLSAFAVGGIVAMSSTAIVVKELTKQREINSKVGKNAIGILLAQDLAVIPFIILLASFSSVTTTKPFAELIFVLFNFSVAFFLIFVSRRWLLKPLFRIVSATRELELFTCLVLLVALSTAWLTHWLGLSYVLGSFLAGVMLSETDFRHQIEVEVRPFRDVLLGLFFITIGMLLDVSTWYHTWVWILLLVMALVFCKTVLIIILCRVAGDDYFISCRTGLILAQGGEFGFAILTFVLSKDLLSPDYGQVVLAALWISIAISPLLIRYNKIIANFFFPTISQINEALVQQEIIGLSHDLNDHIILCGYGRVGQHIARLLEIENIAFIGLELDPMLVQNARLAGKRVTYGDASHPGMLTAAGFSQAKAMVISFSDFPTSIKILSIAKQLKASIPILVRCRDETEMEQLKEQGATRVIAEVLEEGLSLAHHLMQVVKISDVRIHYLMQDLRNHNYDLLQGTPSGSLDEILDLEKRGPEQLRPVILKQGAYAINRCLGDLNLTQIKVAVVAIRQGESKKFKPSPIMRLNLEDIIVLFGDEINLEKAEKIILEGD